MAEYTRRNLLISLAFVIAALIAVVIFLIFSGPIDAEVLEKVPGAPQLSEVRNVVRVKERVYPAADPDRLLERWRNGMETFSSFSGEKSRQERIDELEGILGALEEELEHERDVNMAFEDMLDALTSYLEGVPHV